MISDFNIVCLASNWFAHPTSKQHVMRILSERNHVVWVNYHASRLPRFTRSDVMHIGRRLVAAARGNRRTAQEAVTLLSPLLLPIPQSRLARWVNAQRLNACIRSALRRLPPRPLQLWLFTPDAPDLIPRLAPDQTIYYCVDDFAAFSGYDAQLVDRLERRTVAASDVVLATSEPLVEKMRRCGARPHFIPHGVDVDHFGHALAAGPTPPELADLPRPIIGYFGLISDYVDLALLAELARRRPQWSFVLIGDAACDTSVCAGLPNLHLLGRRRYADLPDYCRAFDVGVIPFAMSRLVRAVNPIKLREYLAAGLPVVSTPMPEVLRYDPTVRAADGADAWLAACEAALGDPTSRAERQALVRDESWRSRVELISSHVAAAKPASRDSAAPSDAALPVTSG